MNAKENNELRKNLLEEYPLTMAQAAVKLASKTSNWLSDHIAGVPHAIHERKPGSKQTTRKFRKADIEGLINLYPDEKERYEHDDRQQSVQSG